MCSVLIGAVVNIALDPLFIFVFHMGVAGAAVATILSQALSAAWVLKFLCSGKSGIRLRLSGMRPDFALLRQGDGTWRFSLYHGGYGKCHHHCDEPWPAGLRRRSLCRIHDDPSECLQLVFVPINGFTTGVQPIISYNFGAGSFDRVKMTIRRMISVTFLAAFLYVVFAMLRPGVFARLFTTDEELIALVKKGFAGLYVRNVCFRHPERYPELLSGAWPGEDLSLHCAS